MQEWQFKAEYTDEAKAQLKELAYEYREKIVETIGIFEKVGTKYKNINNLGDGLFEIKPKSVRAYFMYDSTRRKIIIVGFICLKQTQKAPKQYIKQARTSIRNYINKLEVIK